MVHSLKQSPYKTMKINRIKPAQWCLVCMVDPHNGKNQIMKTLFFETEDDMMFYIDLYELDEQYHLHAQEIQVINLKTSI